MKRDSVWGSGAASGRAESCGGSGTCAIGMADKFCPNCPVPNAATLLGWDERGYEWTDTQGSHWKCIDAQWCWYSPSSRCWHRGDRQVMEFVGPFTRVVESP